MKQAIEEGFILDVLSSYTPVDSYYNLVKMIEDDPEFDSKKAQRKLRRYVQSRRAMLAMLNGLDMRVGFPDGRVMNLALAHEYGTRSADGSALLPERPAYRAARKAMRLAWRRRSRAILREASRPGSSPAGVLTMVRAAVKEQRDLLRQSYLTFEGTPLSEVQRARKRGTAYETTELQGREGPKLIGHIAGWVNGAEV